VSYFALEPHAGLGSVVVVGVALASLVGVLIFRLIRTLRRRRRARDFRERVNRVSPPGLAPGSIELAGTVEADDSGPPLSVRIVQRGVRVWTLHGPGLWQWRESARTVVARPFTLVLHGTGARVRIDCDERVVLQARADVVAAMDDADTGGRTWDARVRQGERVAITGNLVADGIVTAGESEGYRGASEHHALILRAGDGERLRVVAESAGVEEDRILAGRYRNLDLLGAALALLFVVAAAAYGSDIHESRTAMGTISVVKNCRTGKGNSTYLCFDAVYPVVGVDSISASRICRAVPWDPDVEPPDRLSGGGQVIVSFLPGDPARCNVGARLTGSLWELLVLTLVPMAIGLAAAVVRFRRGADGLWYDREPLCGEELD
jgi:hypothetical protein